ncbi:CsbD family protein [Nocardioides anomalus]|uniref:CsbD family protein n=1 Tax=Nocardioides anomalus TaxID=2712223 RepID=A0A6G6W9Y3_9ACTN|nr:CsbD family protein [Nocardioides anomalus]QIG42161.1 CsbD family protein [Nocardioides anomalus]
MGMVDKAKNAAEDALGKAKEKVGELTGDEKLEAEGNKDQAKASAKDTVEDVKDVFRK